MPTFVRSSKIWDSRASLIEERPARVRSSNRLSAAEDRFVHDKVILRSLPNCYSQRPEEFFTAIASYTAELKENLLKNRIVKDQKLLADKDEDIRMYRSILAQILTEKICDPDLTLVDRLSKLPKMNDELDTLVHDSASPKKREDANIDLVLHTMHTQINSLKAKVTTLEDYNSELSKSNISLQKKTSHYSLSAKKSTASSPPQQKGDSKLLGDLKRKKLIDLITIISSTYMNSENLVDLWELDFKSLQLLKADRAQLFKLDRAKGAFATKFNGVLQLMSVKNSLLTVAYTQKQILLVPDSDVTFDNKINSIFGGSSRQMDIMPILNSSGQPVAMLVVLRRNYSRGMSELVLIGSILAASFELHDVKKSSELHKRAMNLTLRACDMLYQYSDFCAFTSDAAQLATELIKAERAQVLMVNEDRGELFRRVRQETGPDQFQAFPISSGVAGFCATKKTHVITNDLHSHRFYTQEIDDPTENSRSIVCVPLPISEAGKKVQAVLIVADKLDGKEFSVDDCELLKLYGSVLIRIAESVQIREDYRAMKSTCKKIVEIATDFSSNFGIGNLSSLQRLIKTCLSQASKSLD